MSEALNIYSHITQTCSRLSQSDDRKKFPLFMSCYRQKCAASKNNPSLRAATMRGIRVMYAKSLFVEGIVRMRRVLGARYFGPAAVKPLTRCPKKPFLHAHRAFSICLENILLARSGTMRSYCQRACQIMLNQSNDARKVVHVCVRPCADCV
jgi:hypothetical protein